MTSLIFNVLKGAGVTAVALLLLLSWFLFRELQESNQRITELQIINTSNADSLKTIQDGIGRVDSLILQLNNARVEQDMALKEQFQSFKEVMKNEVNSNWGAVSVPPDVAGLLRNALNADSGTRDKDSSGSVSANPGP